MSDQTNENTKSEKILSILIAAVIVVFSLICFLGLTVSVIVFAKNQQTFNGAYSEAVADIAGLTDTEQDTAQMILEHLEKLQKIQKDGATNDVMSFIYSTLSTILVGLCAGFVAKSYKNVEKAKQSVDDAKKNAEDAKESALTANQKAKDAEKYADAAKTESENCVKNSENNVALFNKEKEQLKEEMERTIDRYQDAIAQIKKQEAITSILNIHVEILHARASLLSGDKISANEKIYHIEKMVGELGLCSDRGIIVQLEQELLGLETAVEHFEEHAKTVSNEGERISKLQAVIRYKNSLENAVSHCDSLLG